MAARLSEGKRRALITNSRKEGGGTTVPPPSWYFAVMPSEGLEPPTPWSEALRCALMAHPGMCHFLALAREKHILSDHLCRAVAANSSGVAHAVAHVAHGYAV